MIKKIHLIVLIVMVVGLQQSFSQSYNFKTTGFSVLEKNEKGKWGKWSDLELATMMVTLDTNKNRIVIYSQIIQLFEITSYHKTEENESDIVYGFSAKDNEGTACVLTIMVRKKQDNRKQLYINYDDHIIVYNIFNMD